MKFISVSLIMLSSFFAGKAIKNSARLKLDFFNYLSGFCSFFLSGMNLFKSSVVEIIDNFLLLQKNAKFNEIFRKKGEIYIIDEEKVKKYVGSAEEKTVICGFLNGIGTNEYGYETEKFKNFSNYLEEKKRTSLSEIKLKADLLFKVALSVGGVISILIW